MNRKGLSFHRAALPAAVMMFGTIAPVLAADLPQERRVDFVVHGIGNALAVPGQIDKMCSDGRSLGYRQIYEQSPEGTQREDEPFADWEARVVAGAMGLATVDGKNLCLNPELGPEDPHYRLMEATGIVSYGINLDGQVSTRDGKPAPGTCAQDSFVGVAGRVGVNNQMLRVVGCDGAGEQYDATEHSGDLPDGVTGVSEMMLQGGWGILISVRNVDSLENDDDVEVGIYANADPITLSGGTAVPFATYAADEDLRFRAETRGRIVDGVLTTDPVDARFHWLVAGMHVERPLSDARLEVTFNDEGGIEGYLAGYTPVEAMYDVNYGFRSATGDDGELVPAERTTYLSVLGNSVMGRTCHGGYQALYAMADGHPDPETGRCTSISTQYWIRATPAFVVDAGDEGEELAER